MKLYTAWYCPFAQRTLITRLHKGLDFEYVETDPYGKTEQGLNISRQTGDVTVLLGRPSNTL
jgi:glutathione S-transferase